MTPRIVTVPYLLAGRFQRLQVACWGDPALPAVVCVHGLTRQGRDFDALAGALADRHHVLAPDLPGRGGSDWLPDPMLYTPASYVVALSHLLATLSGPIGWVGTSLGGICGMAIAAVCGTAVTRLVLNDIGPAVPAGALARIHAYLAARPPEFADAAAVEAYLRAVHAPFGPLTDSQWRHLAAYSTRTGAAGALQLHYDPAIAVPILALPPADADLSALYDAVACPMLAIRGADSDLLTAGTFAAMQPRCHALTVPATGHAPALMAPAEIAAIRAFLA